MANSVEDVEKVAKSIGISVYRECEHGHRATGKTFRAVVMAAHYASSGMVVAFISRNASERSHAARMTARMLESVGVNPVGDTAPMASARIGEGRITFLHSGHLGAILHYKYDAIVVDY